MVVTTKDTEFVSFWSHNPFLLVIIGGLDDIGKQIFSRE